MKKTLFICTVTLLALTACKKEVVVTPSAVTPEKTADNTTTPAVSLTDLPEPALATINKHYRQEDIASYEVKTVPVIGRNFEVKFNDGAEIDFDSNGNWHEWKDVKGLPKEVVPEKIASYIAKNYANTFATSIDKEAKKIKVDLASDVDLEFDEAGNFLRIDD